MIFHFVFLSFFTHGAMVRFGHGYAFAFFRSVSGRKMSAFTWWNHWHLDGWSGPDGLSVFFSER